AQRLTVIGKVLERVEREDRVEGPGAERQLERVAAHDALDAAQAAQADRLLRDVDAPAVAVALEEPERHARGGRDIEDLEAALLAMALREMLLHQTPAALVPPVGLLDLEHLVELALIHRRSFRAVAPWFSDERVNIAYRRALSKARRLTE